MEQEMERRSSHCEEFQPYFVDTISAQSVHLLQLSGTKLNLLLRSRPEPNMFKILPKMLSGISQNICLLCTSCSVPS